MRGRHYTTYVAEVQALTRAGPSEEAERLLLDLVDATEREARTEECGVAPWYYERLAILYRKRKDIAAELSILERYEKQPHAPGVGPRKLADRLTRLRATAQD